MESSDTANTIYQLGLLIKHKAHNLGFDACGFARVEEVNHQHGSRLLQWLAEGHHGRMKYMENYREQRLDPSVLVPEAKSVVALAINYHQENFQPAEAHYKISQYAAGIDYHYVVKSKLYQLLEFIQQHIPAQNARVFTDSAPVLERYWAQRAGLGAPGKNSCLILPRKGSYFFLAEIILDVELCYDQPLEKDFCGTCSLCMDACPNKAIVEPGKIDARKCISYLTIELKDDVPEEFVGKTSQYIFGCDICQQVCPHNKSFATPCNEHDFQPLSAISLWNKADWDNLQKKTFRKHLLKTKSSLARVSFDKLMNSMKSI